MSFDLSDYNTVAERLGDFRAAFPEGSLQADIVAVPAPFAEKFLAVRACAYRTPDDPRPGVGLAWEPMPGRTSFTKDSELQNAETAAWGRAIIAALAADTRKGVASRDEIQARRADHDDQRKAVFAQLNGVGITERDQRLEWASDVLGRRVTTFTTLTHADYTALLEWFAPARENAATARDVGESTKRALGSSATDPETGLVRTVSTPQGRGGGAVATLAPPLVHPSPSPSGEEASMELRLRIAAAHAAWAKTMPKGAEAWLNGYLAHVHKKDLNECGLVELEAGWDWLVALNRDR